MDMKKSILTLAERRDLDRRFDTLRNSIRARKHTATSAAAEPAQALPPPTGEGERHPPLSQGERRRE
jgi:hypothetical protein